MLCCVRQISRSYWLRVCIVQGMLYTVAFGVVYLVAVLNPSSFLIILEVFTSLGLNLGTLYLSIWIRWIGAHGDVCLFCCIM